MSSAAVCLYANKHYHMVSFSYLFSGKRAEILSSIEKGIELTRWVPQLPKVLFRADAWDMG